MKADPNESGPSMRPSASAYLEALSALMVSAKVTDRQGTSMPLDDGVARAVDLLLSVQETGRKIMLVGNGGSAAIVSHVHNDLCKALGVRAIVFNEIPLLTALANDIAYTDVFQQPVKLWAEAGDILVAVSSSGKSENILRAARAANERGSQLITLSGFHSDNPLRSMGQVNFYVKSNVYGFVETSHAALLHALTDCAIATRRPDDARFAAWSSSACAKDR